MSRTDSHRWNRREVTAMLTAIINEISVDPERFEKPTSRRFYDKIKLKCALPPDVTWKTMKNKMQHLKSGYVKILEWKKRKGPDRLNEKSLSVIDHIRSKCEYYSFLKNIFGDNRNFLAFNMGNVKAEQSSQLPEWKGHVEIGFLDEADWSSEEKYTKTKYESSPVVQRTPKNWQSVTMEEDDLESQGDADQNTDGSTEDNAEIQHDLSEYIEYAPFVKNPEEHYETSRKRPKYASNGLTTSQNSPERTSLKNKISTSSGHSKYFSDALEKVFKERINVDKQKTELDQEMNAKRLALEEKRYALAVRKVALEEKRLKLEQDSQQKKFDLHKMEIESNKTVELARIQSAERLRILEIEAKNNKD